MERLEFDNFEDLVCDIADKYDAIKYEERNDIAIIAKYEEAKQIIKELLCIGYDIYSIELHDYEWDGYNAEYIISLCNDEIYCEPMLKRNGYIDDDPAITYILDNCSSKIISHLNSHLMYEVGFTCVDDVDDDPDKEPECTCSKCDRECSDGLSLNYSKDSNDDIHGFTATRSEDDFYKSVSFYSSDKLSMKDIQAIMQEFKI